MLFSFKFEHALQSPCIKDSGHKIESLLLQIVRIVRDGRDDSCGHSLGDVGCDLPSATLKPDRLIPAKSARRSSITSCGISDSQSRFLGAFAGMIGRVDDDWNLHITEVFVD